MEMRKHQNKAHVSPKTPVVNRVTHACKDGYRFQTLKKHRHIFLKGKKNRRVFFYIKNEGHKSIQKVIA